MGSGQSLLSVFSPRMDLPSSDQEKMGRKEKRKSTDRGKKNKKKQRTSKDGNLFERTEVESVDGACKIHEAMKLLMSVVDVNSRPEDLIRLKTDGTPEMEINEPLCVECLHKIHDQIVELKQKSIKKRKPNWSELPIELLESILLKLVPSEFDILGFRHIRNFKVVCRSWRAAAKSCSSYVPLPRTPCLLYHEISTTSRLFDPIGKKSHKIRNVCDFFLHARIVGSSYGWLIMFYDDDDSGESKAHLFNPITRASIPIPGEDTLYNFDYYKFVSQVIISSNPSCTKNFVVVLEYKEGRQFEYAGRLAYYKHGDEDLSWKTLHHDDECYNSFVFHDDHLVASTSKFTKMWNFKEYPPSQRSIIEEIEDSYYLMVSLTGEILRLSKSYEGRAWYEDYEGRAWYEDKYVTLQFSVEKLNLAEDKWEKLQNLRDQSIFFFEDFWSSYSSQCRWQLMSVPNSCFLGCEKNSIYYGTSNLDEYVRYDLEKEKMETVMESDSEKSVMKVFSEDLKCYNCRDPLLWIIPHPW